MCDLIEMVAFIPNEDTLVKMVFEVLFGSENAILWAPDDKDIAFLFRIKVVNYMHYVVFQNDIVVI